MFGDILICAFFLVMGGAGGFLWGAKVERATLEAVINAKLAAAGVATAADSAVQAVKKAL